MVTSSKILTVTYGTFSCTLEGFDDPFTTLQMVAEYFRKLAAEDRYFGGIPQVPDTDTLKRIAEENNPHGINAEIGDNGIILRQAEAHEQATPVDAGATTAREPVFDSVRNDDAAQIADTSDKAGPADETGDKAVPAPSPVTFFTSRRPTQRPVAASVSSPSSDPVNVAAAVAAVSVPALRQHGAQKTVEETLAAIRQNVEQAENGIAKNDDTGDTASGLAKADVTLPVTETPQSDAPLVLDANVGVATTEETAKADADKRPSDKEEIAENEIQPSQPDMPETSTDDPAGQTPIVEKPAAATGDHAPQPVASSLTLEQENELARDLEAAIASDQASAPDAGAAPDATDTPETKKTATVDTGDKAATEAETETEAETRRKRAAALLAAQETTGDQALERLLETTQSKMDKPEQLRRMNALEQLKAAVAATEAEQQITHSTATLTNIADVNEDTADLAAYRDDLRRAQSSTRIGSHMPTPAAKQSPLILVSEQRIDEPAANALEGDTPESPLEVAKTDGNLALKPEFEAQTGADMITPDESGEIQGIPADAFSEAHSFSDFAERIGAFDLPDLLEASAAYTSIIESQPRFSRAQVMSKIATLNHGDAFSKEAGLRAFGKLLREGKILRVQDGQFGISRTSRFSIASRYND